MDGARGAEEARDDLPLGAGVTDTIAMAVTGHRTRAVFDRYDIVSEADPQDASAKLQDLMGTISGTISGSSKKPKPVKASA